MNDLNQSNLSGNTKIKRENRILAIIRSFTAVEKVIFSVFVIGALISALIMTWKINKTFLVPVPAYGGSITEGIIGLPRSINPVLAFTDVDKDLSTLIYSGLTKYEDGKLVGDLAKGYSVSDDGLDYMFVLKEGVKFHDGTPLTTDDIEFTIQKIQDAALKSPKRADWANVTIRKENDKEIHFVLKQPYPPFLANTTIGILPKHIWKNVDADQFIFSKYNIEPIGSGPYEVSSVQRDNGGVPESYVLKAFGKDYDKEAYISKIIAKFYPNEKDALNAYSSGAIESVAGISPQEAQNIASSTKEISVLHTPLPRIFGVFFNQNNSPVLGNKEVRQALDISAPKERIVKNVLYGYGVSIDGPLPSSISQDTMREASSTEKAKALLAKNGWAIGPDGILEKKDKKSTQVLEFSIATADAPDLKQSAEILKVAWEELGAKVNIKVFEYGDLSQNIIKTRKYDALLLGEFIGKDLDLYAFWHSSQRNSPGLNVAMYVNSRTDKLLEDARSTLSTSAKEKNLAEFEKIIKEDVPAVFLYSPEYIYIVPKKLSGVDLDNITNSSDRWYGVREWFINTDYVWKFFENIKEKINKM